jgi:hypothetical protein
LRPVAEGHDSFSVLRPTTLMSQVAIEVRMGLTFGTSGCIIGAKSYEA